MSSPSGSRGEPEETDVVRSPAGFGPEGSPVPGHSFTELWRQHHSHCLSLARRLVKDEQLAHDVVQEAFLAVWRSGRGNYRPDLGSFAGWLLTITHHHAVNAIRSHERERNRHRAVASSVVVEAGISRPGVDEEVLSRIRKGRLLTALTRLSLVQREVLMLAYFGGLTQPEIAAVTGAPLGTVKTRTRDALLHLRTALADS